MADATERGLTWSRSRIIVGVLVPLLSAFFAVVAWSRTQGQADARTRAAIDANAQAIDANARAIDALQDVPTRIDEIQREQTYIRDDVRWLVRRAGGTPASGGP